MTLDFSSRTLRLSDQLIGMSPSAKKFELRRDHNTRLTSKCTRRNPTEKAPLACGGTVGEGVHECASKSASMMAVVVHLTVTAALLSPVHPGQQPWSRPSGGLGRSKFSVHLAVDGGAGGPGGGITGGGGGDDENSDDTNDVASMVAGRGLDFEALPGDMVNALRAGRIGDAELANWAKVLTNPLTRAMAASGFLRARLLSDPRLTSVLGIEVAQGVFSTLAAEKAARGKRFMKEIDFVIANQVSFNAAPPLL